MLLIEVLAVLVLVFATAMAFSDKTLHVSAANMGIFFILAGSDTLLAHPINTTFLFICVVGAIYFAVLAYKLFKRNHEHI